MELVAALPAELAAIADPAARGAAPLLRATAAAGSPAAAGAPFDLFLELLAMAVPSGEGLPAGGKDLPRDAGEPEPDDGATDPALAAVFAALPLPLLDPAAPPVPIAPAPAPAAVPAALVAVATEVPAPAGPLPAAAPTPTDSDGARESSPATIAAADEWQTLFAAAPTDDGAPAPQPATAALRDALFAASAARPSPPPAAVSAAAAAAIVLAPADAPTRAAVPVAEVVAPAVRALQRDAEVAPAPALATTDLSSAPVHALPGAAAHPAPTAAHAPQAPALPQPSVDLRSPTWHEAFASRVQVLVDTQVGEARIKLHPPELGAVDVKISLVDDQTFVHLTTSSASARDELAHGLPRLRELFSASGLELGGASVHNGRDGRHDAGGYAAHAAPEDRDALEQAFADGPTAAAPRRAAGRIDVFA